MIYVNLTTIPNSAGDGKRKAGMFQFQTLIYVHVTCIYSVTFTNSSPERKYSQEASWNEFALYCVKYI